MRVALQNSGGQCVDEWTLPCMHARLQLSRSVVCVSWGPPAGRGGAEVPGGRTHGDTAGLPFSVELNPHSAPSWL